MRDAFGGVFMIRLMLVFLFIYVVFSAISLNYAKAFKVKNNVISYLEEHQIKNFSNLERTRNMNGFTNMLRDSGYKKTCRNGNGPIRNDENEIYAYCVNGVYMVFHDEDRYDNYVDYDIYTYADWNMGILNLLLALGGRRTNGSDVVDGSWEIEGTARVVIR